MVMEMLDDPELFDGEAIVVEDEHGNEQFAIEFEDGHYDDDDDEEQDNDFFEGDTDDEMGEEEIGEN